MASPYSNRNKASSEVCVGAYLVNPAGESLKCVPQSDEELLISQEDYYEVCKEWLQKKMPNANVRTHNMKVVTYNGEDRQDTASCVEISRGTLQKHSVVEIAEDDDGGMKIEKKSRL